MAKNNTGMFLSLLILVAVVWGVLSNYDLTGPLTTMMATGILATLAALIAVMGIFQKTKIGQMMLIWIILLIVASGAGAVSNIALLGGLVASISTAVLTVAVPFGVISGINAIARN